MHKKWSLYIGGFSGIKVFIHWTFLILLGWVFFMHFRLGHGISQALSGILFILLLFACVVLHEFGHALTAKRFGVKTRDITVYPIGGIASLESMPAKPSEELQVSLAGPVVSLLIALILWIYLKVTGQVVNPAALSDENFTGLPFAFNLMYANIILAIFNLIPAFPMDGGRILRSLLAMKMDPAKATSIAAKTGQILAIAFVFIGFFYNFWLVFIGLFIFLGASAESHAAEIKQALKGVRAKNIMLTDFTMVDPYVTLEAVAKQLLTSNAKSFLVAENNKVVGILNFKEIIENLHKGNLHQNVGEIMQKNFRSFRNDEYISDQLQVMQQERQSIFPVMDNDDKVIGIIPLDNIYIWAQAKPYIP